MKKYNNDNNISYTIYNIPIRSSIADDRHHGKVIY